MKFNKKSVCVLIVIVVVILCSFLVMASSSTRGSAAGTTSPDQYSQSNCESFGKCQEIDDVWKLISNIIEFNSPGTTDSVWVPNPNNVDNGEWVSYGSVYERSVIEESIVSVSASTCSGSYSILCEKYGSSQIEIENNLKKIQFLNFEIYVNKDLENVFKNAEANLGANCFNDPDYLYYGYGRDLDSFLSSAGGTYNYRCIQHKGTPPDCEIGLSPHAFGVAIDIRPDLNSDYHKSSSDDCDHKMPQCIINSFKDAGFTWGGDWSTYCDPMHFEYIPN